MVAIATFPNVFELDENELTEVKKLMDEIVSINANESPAIFITAYQALTCAVFSMMRNEQKTSKADLLYVANLMHEGMIKFINRL
jgi:polysaccharide deacetylase 2 family uncharacterized protein YibQ